MVIPSPQKDREGSQQSDSGRSPTLTSLGQSLLLLVHLCKGLYEIHRRGERNKIGGGLCIFGFS